MRIEGGVEAIVDTETFNAVSKIIAKRKRATSSTAKHKYLLSGKIICGECSAAYTGMSRHSGRNKTLYVSYRCGQNTLKAGLTCNNKEVSRNLLETFIITQLAEVIFDKNTVDHVVRQYSDYCRQNGCDNLDLINGIEKNLAATESKIENLISVMESTGSKAVIKKLELLEKQHEQLEKELLQRKANSTLPHIDEGKIRAAYELAKKQYLSGSLEERQQLINHYLNKVVVYKEHIEVFLNVLPTYLFLNEFIENGNRHKFTGYSEFVPEAGGGEGN